MNHVGQQRALFQQETPSPVYRYRMRVHGREAGAILEANHAVRELVRNVRPGAGALSGLSEVVCAEDRTALRRHYQAALAGETSVIEYRIAEGEKPIWLRESCSLDRSSSWSGEVTLLSDAIDVTEQINLASRLSDSEHYRSTLLSLLGGFVIEMSPDGRIIAISGEFDTALSHRIRDCGSSTIMDLLPSDSAAHWSERLSLLHPDMDARQFRFCYVDHGVEHTYIARLFAPHAGQYFAAIRAMDHSVVDTMSSGLFDSLPMPVFLMGHDLRILDANSALVRLLETSREQLASSPLFGMLPIERERKSLLRDVNRSESRHGFSHRLTMEVAGQEGSHSLNWHFVPAWRGLGWIACCRMIDDSQSASTQIVKRTKRILDHLADGVLTLTADGLISGISRVAAKIFDMEPDDLVGHPVSDWLIEASTGEPVGGFGQIVSLLDSASHGCDMLARKKNGETLAVEIVVKRDLSEDDAQIVVSMRDITVRLQTEQAMKQMLYRDSLTSLPNKVLFHDRLTQAIERAKRHRHSLSVMTVDLDRFKLINDSLGLRKGDKVLDTIGKRLSSSLRKSDTVARLGGDEFLILLNGTESADAAAKVAQTILNSLKPMMTVDDQELSVSASIGIALFPYDGEDAEHLIRNADTAMHRAKDHGRGCYQFYTTDMNASAYERLKMETALRKALSRDEFTVHYQPQVRLSDGKITGMEALIRWYNPELGHVSPGDFIPLAEETGLITEIGQFVLRTACGQLRKWHNQGHRDLRIAVNLSARQFRDPSLVQHVEEVILDSGLKPEFVDLELTESAIMAQANRVVDRLNALAALGVVLTVDDFGTGYSSLAYLKKFPIHCLKIDRSFVRDITHDPNDAAIADAIIALTRTLSLRVVAEGVETLDQLQQLKAADCDEVQGYLISRPDTADNISSLLERENVLPEGAQVA